MILEKLCDLARHEQLLADADYEPKPVAGIIAVANGGKLVGFIPTAGVDGKGKKTRGKIMQIPRRSGRTSGAAANFLVDKYEYVFGVEPEGSLKPKKPEDLLKRQKLFRDSVRKGFEATGEVALEAVDAFLASDSERQRALERLPATGYFSNDLFAFEYRGRLVHELPAVRKYFTDTRRGTSSAGVQCLICGTISPPVEKHPGVKIPGGATNDIVLVSFNSDAFESYGLERNQNAPVCRDCADAYTTALGRLLSDRYPDPRNFGKILPRRFVRLVDDVRENLKAEPTRSAIARPPCASSGGAELRVLRVLAARHPARFTRAQWATLSGMKRTGGTWQTYVSRLRTAGHIEESDGFVGISKSGLEAAGRVEAPAPGSMVEQWKSALGSGPSKMIDVLLKAHPSAMRQLRR